MTLPAVSSKDVDNEEGEREREEEVLEEEDETGQDKQSENVEMVGEHSDSVVEEAGNINDKGAATRGTEAPVKKVYQ